MMVVYEIFPTPCVIKMLKGRPTEHQPGTDDGKGKIFNRFIFSQIQFWNDPSIPVQNIFYSLRSWTRKTCAWILYF